MKRNMRFLLLFAILASSIFAAYFISGCGDDTTVFEDKDDNSWVVGTIHGTVSDAYNNERLVNCKVVWTGDSTFTDSNGYYTTGATLSTGDYMVSFYPDGATHAQASFTGRIHDVSWHQAATNATGQITEVVDLPSKLWPFTGRLTGYVYSDLPQGVSKDGGAGLALDPGPNNATAAPNVTVTLDLREYGIVDDKKTAVTDNNGYYEFLGVPACQASWQMPQVGDDTAAVWASPWLCTSAFTDEFGTRHGGVCYGEDCWLVGGVITCSDTNYSFNILPESAGGTIFPNIYAPLEFAPPKPLTGGPRVITYSWDGLRIDVTDDLVVNFSHSMSDAQTEITLKKGGTTTASFDPIWSNDDKTVTLNPFDPLVTSKPGTDAEYEVTIIGRSTAGLPLKDWDGAAWRDTFIRDNIKTQVGIAFETNNLASVGMQPDPADAKTWVEVLVDTVFEFTFNMPPVLGLPTVISFTSGSATGAAVGFAPSVSGNTLTITPTVALTEETHYFVSYKLYSAIPGDFTEVPADSSAYDLLSAGGPPLPPPVLVDYLDTVDFDTTQIWLEWEVMPAADYFLVWANDDFENLDQRIVGKVDAQQSGVTQKYTVDLSSGSPYVNTVFDRYDNDTLLAGGNLQTPFAEGTNITFWVQGYRGTVPGAFSDPQPFEDNVGPTDFILNSNHYGSADNTAGSEAAMPYIFLGSDADDASLIEFTDGSDPVVDFDEAGGDPGYVPDELTDVTFDGWDGSLRFSDSTLFVTIPAGSAGSGDWMYVTIKDNSGNPGTDSIRLAPYIDIIHPSDTTTTVFKAPNFNVEWNVMEPLGGGVVDTLDLFISYDGGTTWDTLVAGADMHKWANETDNGETTGSGTLGLDDTVRVADCQLALAAKEGGFKFPSTSFIYAGLKMMMTASDSTDLKDGDLYWFDRAWTDSTEIPWTFEAIGLDTIILEFSDDAWATTETAVDTFLPDSPEALTTYTMADFDYFPYRSGTTDEYDCYLGIQHVDGQPANALPWSFVVTHDEVIFTLPVGGTDAEPFGVMNISWWNILDHSDSLFSLIDLEYAFVDDTAGGDGPSADTNWIPVPGATDIRNVGWFAWSDLPANVPSDSVIMRLVDASNDGLDTTGQFTFEGIRIDAPVITDTLETGSSFNVDFKCYGGWDSTYTVEVSIDGGTEWETAIATGEANGGGDPETYAWNPIGPYATTTGKLRIREDGVATSDTLSYAITDFDFVIKGFQLTYPTANDTFFVGRNDSVIWTTIGTFDSTDVFLYTDWATAATHDTLAYPTNNVNRWDIPTVPATSDGSNVGIVKVMAHGGVAMDTIASVSVHTPSLTIDYPTGGENIQMSSIDSIQWTTIGSRTGHVEIRLSINGGTDYPDSLIIGSSVVDDASSELNPWIPKFVGAQTYNNCKILVRETWPDQGTAYQDESAVFNLVQ